MKNKLLLRPYLFLRFKSVFEKNLIFLFFSLLQIIFFLMFLNHFIALISKIIFKNKKKIYYISKTKIL
jgi:hypothetical protein